MTVRLEVSAIAFADVDAIVDSLHGRNPVAAIRFADALDETFEHIRGAPRAYPKLRSSRRAHQGLRSRTVTRPFDRYRVFYSVDDDLVRVVRFLHSARNIDRLLGDSD